MECHDDGEGFCHHGTCDECVETAVLARAASLLAELYEPAGVLIYWSSPISYLDDRRPCDLWRERDLEALEKMCNRLDAICDGAFL